MGKVPTHAEGVGQGALPNLLNHAGHATDPRVSLRTLCIFLPTRKHSTTVPAAVALGLSLSES